MGGPGSSSRLKLRLDFDLEVGEVGRSRKSLQVAESRVVVRQSYLYKISVRK
jgi:hypothetical protein